MSFRSFSCIAIIACMLASLAVPASAQGHRGEGEPPLDRTLLELPAIGGREVVLVYSGFVVNYNPARLIPNWVAYELTAEELDGDVPRARGFGMDLAYRQRQAMREDYSSSGWDKGHMAPSADMKWSRSAMNESFYLTNICPQDHELNGRDWHALENRVRGWARRYGRVWVVCGPYVAENAHGTIGERKVVVPDGFFKAVLREDGDGAWRAIAFLFRNEPARQPLADAVVSVDEVEELVGFDLFANLPDGVEEGIESAADLRLW